MRKISMVLAAAIVAVFAGNSFAGNCTSGGVQVVQSAPVVLQTQAVAVQQVVAAPVVATVVVPHVTQFVPVFQQSVAVNAFNTVQFQQVRAFGGGGGVVRQAGILNVNGGRGIRAAGVGGGARQFGLININR